MEAEPGAHLSDEAAYDGCTTTCLQIPTSGVFERDGPFFGIPRIRIVLYRVPYRGLLFMEFVLQLSWKFSLEIYWNCRFLFHVPMMEIMFCCFRGYMGGCLWLDRISFGLLPECFRQAAICHEL